MGRVQFRLFELLPIVDHLDAAGHRFELHSTGVAQVILHGNTNRFGWIGLLAVYALSHERREAVILYPTVDDAKESQIQICDPLRASATARIALRPVNLCELESLIQSPMAATGHRMRADYAHWLAGTPPDSHPAMIEPLREST